MTEGHHHNTELHDNINRAFIIGIVLNAAFVVVEIIAGFSNNSLALLTDAGHNLSDVGSLLLSLIAFKLAKVKSNDRFTYGYKKTTILASLFNAVILLTAVGAILWEAVNRFSSPREIQGFSVAIVALIGIAINSVTAFMFFRNRKKDLNIKGAYLHLFADALVSLGVVIGGIIMYYTGLYWIDPVLSIIIGVVILYGTFGLLKDSLKLSLDAVPENVEIEKVKSVFIETVGIKDFHHIHIWAISTSQNAMTVHVVVDEKLTSSEITALKCKLKHELEGLNIHHLTVETEIEIDCCNEIECFKN